MNDKNNKKLNTEIKSIIKKHIECIKNVDTSSSNISKIVKSLDSIVNDMYLDLYALRDGRKMQQPSADVDNKKGHCC